MLWVTALIDSPEGCLLKFNNYNVLITAIDNFWLEYKVDEQIFLYGANWDENVNFGGHLVPHALQIPHWTLKAPS